MFVNRQEWQYFFTDGTRL